jgi:hypothetical protein
MMTVRRNQPMTSTNHHVLYLVARLSCHPACCSLRKSPIESGLIAAGLVSANHESSTISHGLRSGKRKKRWTLKLKCMHRN